MKTPSEEGRARFDAVMEELGVTALPVFRAGLERLESRLSTPGAPELAADLLESLPEVSDEATGNIVARYLRVPIAHLARAATSALPRMWGQRACALLLALLQDRVLPASVVKCVRRAR